jgi:hypothetical protein
VGTILHFQQPADEVIEYFAAGVQQTVRGRKNDEWDQAIGEVLGVTRQRVCPGGVSEPIESGSDDHSSA